MSKRWTSPDTSDPIRLGGEPTKEDAEQEWGLRRYRENGLILSSGAPKVKIC